MPIKNYGVLKGKAIDVRRASGTNPHYQVHVIDDNTSFRIAINIQSALAPSELQYLIIEQYSHPILAKLQHCNDGFTALPSQPGGLALDFIRGNLFDRKLMKVLPPNLPGPDNDLNDKIERVMQRAVATEDAVVYAFGQRWGPEAIKDKLFGFQPGGGIHDIHMNQSNVGQFVGDDGVWQDGGLFINFPSEKQWVAIFLKFQSQGWVTDDKTGHAKGSKKPKQHVAAEGATISEVADRLPTMDNPHGMVRIIAALVNGLESPEVEKVTIINASSMNLNIDGWKLQDGNMHEHHLSGTIHAGTTQVITIAKPMELSNKGGLITLLDEEGVKVDGVSYTAEQAADAGWTIIF